MKSNLSEMLMDYIFFWSQMRPGQKETKWLSLRRKWGQTPGSSSRLIFENKKINNKKILSLPNILMCLFYEFAGKFHSICADFRRMNCLYVKNDKSPPCVIYTCQASDEWWVNEYKACSKYLLSINTSTSQPDLWKHPLSELYTFQK